VIEAVLASTNVGQEIEIVVQEVCGGLAKNTSMLFSLLTELRNIGESFDIWLIQDLQLLYSQAALSIVPLGRLLLSRLIQLLSRNGCLILDA